MQRLWILGAVSLMAIGLGVPLYVRLETRLDRLDELRRFAPARVAYLSGQLEELQGDLAALRSELEELDHASGASERGLTERLGRIEVDVARTGQDLAQSRATLAGLELPPPTAIETIEGRVETLEARLQGEWSGLSKSVAATSVLAERTRAELGRISADLTPDVAGRWRETLGPTVQLAGRTTVGSGILIGWTPRGTDVETLVLTAWHVVRDIRADSSEPEPAIPVRLYLETGGVETHQAQLLEYDARIDVALLSFVADAAPANTALLPPRSRLEHLHVFDEVYAVGCPLGNDPIPTRGEIASLQHSVDGNTYWMISAPTYIGNSGGGVFDASTRELLGVFTKIYTHGSLRPTVVPHMGLVTPLPQVYEWLESRGYSIEEIGDRGGRAVAHVGGFASMTPSSVSASLSPVAPQ